MDGVAALPPLRETIARHELDARKRFGQHFLLDINLTRRIARAAAPLDHGTTIEIGPGPGGLTRALLLEGAARVVAIEVDPRALGALAELQAAAAGRLEVIEADALRIDPASLGPAPRRIVANLPYNISTALLVRWLHSADAHRRHGADVPEGGRRPSRRRAAHQGLWPAVGAGPACLRGAAAVRRGALRLRAAAQGHLLRRAADAATRRRSPGRPRAAGKVTAAAFGQRRKMLRGSLSGLFSDPTSTLEGLGLSPTARAEELAVADFVRLSGALTNE